jgi:hypothetical protein
MLVDQTTDLVGDPFATDLDFRKWTNAIIGKTTGIKNASINQTGTSHPRPRLKIERAAKTKRMTGINWATSNGQLKSNDFAISEVVAFMVVMLFMY